MNSTRCPSTSCGNSLRDQKANRRLRIAFENLARACTHKLRIRQSLADVRFAPESGQIADISVGPLWANSGHLSLLLFGKAIRLAPERKLGSDHFMGANDDPCYQDLRHACRATVVSLAFERALHG
jgi:hypothetical protein